MSCIPGRGRVDLGAVVVAVFALSCQAPSDDAEVVAVEANSLGVTQIEIEHRIDGEDRLLGVRGVDASGAAIATVTLRSGLIDPSPNPAADASAELVNGTELVITVGDENQRYVSPDRKAHSIPEPLQASLAS